ncbi:CBO0543 family protein [Alkalihalobacterium elongatum]|uniref:CBO0543 family protein n=1 Tax=Alkalihalobacterium elongatum TaxID=2675466 RepID=UPI001C201108|nr:CBO0543 family protein [Alkalihalobacterium elongatum]
MNRKPERTILSVVTFISLSLLPFTILKRSFKDWIIVYLVSCIGNAFADSLLVSNGYLKYRVRPFKKNFAIHFPFDFIHYPLLLLYYNQWTLNSRPVAFILKLFPFVIPQAIIETIVEKNTDLITWRKGWTWYHSFVSLLAKFLLCRLIIAVIRKINIEKISTT